MYLALDRTRNIKIHASDPTASRFDEYVCLICHSPVHLRKGRKRQPYFAHVSGRADPDCELYMSMIIDGSVLHQSLREHSYCSLELYVRIFEIGDTHNNWQLQMYIPEPDHSIGNLVFPFAYGGKLILPVNSIGRGGRKVSIRPRYEPYCIGTENLSEGNWTSKIKQPVSGLSAHGFSLFRYSPVAGRKLADDSTLYWGHTYVLVWNASNFEPPWWPHKGNLTIIALQNQDHWHGVTVKFPSEYDSQVEIWANTLLKHAVEFPPAQVSLVSPLLTGRLDDGSLVISPNTQVIIGVVGEMETRSWQEIKIAVSSRVQIMKYSHDGQSPFLLSLGLIKPGRIEIWLDDNSQDSLNLLCDTDFLPLPMFQGVLLRGEGIDDGQEVVETLCSSTAQWLLEQVHQKKVVLTGFEIPNGIPLTIRWNLGESEWNEWITNKSELVTHERNVDDTAFSLLSKILYQSRLILEINAGDFGKVKVQFDNITSNYQISMGRKWREKVKWLLSLSRMYHGNTLVYIEKNSFHINTSIIKLFEEQDQLLLLNLLSYRTWPRSLETHLRAAINECYMVRKVHRQS